MKIFGLISRNSGPGFHRIMMPLLMMPEIDCYITNAVEEANFEERRPDWIYYNRVISDEVLRLQSKYHFRIAVDFDDYWHLDPHHIMFRYSRDNNVPAHHIKHMRLADLVTTTHERLAEQIYQYNKNVLVVPNAIPNNEYFPTKLTDKIPGVTRMFWQGSITHEADVKMLKDTIKKLDPARFRIVVAGYTNEPAWERMANYLTNNQKLPGVVLPGLPPYEYYRNYKYADVALVPLLSTKFNQYKSNLKILEAAHVGVPVIASNVHPYKDMPGVMYVNNREDWARWLNDQSGWEQSAATLKAYCQENFNFDKINLKRLEAFKK